MNSMEHSSLMECKNECKTTDNCNWFSYNSPNNSTCLLYNVCPEKDNDEAWITSQKECHNYQCYIPMKCSLGSVSE